MGFKLVSVNLNGIRSAATKGWLDWVERERPDFIGVQELKAQAADLAKGGFERIGANGELHGHFHCAEKKGYSGVGLYSRHEPSEVRCGVGDAHHDAEGRWVELRFDRPGRAFSVVSCYFPSGTTGEERQAVKYRFLAHLRESLRAMQRSGREFVLVGDVNIAHREIDLKNWKGNLKNSGFLPEERAWMTALLAPPLGEAAAGDGLVDVFRTLNAAPEQYTWWSQRGQARAKNVGWRIDYHLATPAVAATAHSPAIYTAEYFSDHAPLTISYDWAL